MGSLVLKLAATLLVIGLVTACTASVVREEDAHEPQGASRMSIKQREGDPRIRARMREAPRKCSSVCNR